MNKRNKKILIIIIIFIALSGVYFSYSRTTKEVPSLSDKILKDEIPGEISVYDFMNKLRSEGKMNFTEKDYAGMGKFIDSIDEIKNNGNQNWIYYVNNKKANIGISNYKINSGDTVTWKYENEI